MYSLNLALCLHLAISSFLLLNNFFWLWKKQNVDFFFRTQIAPTIERLWGIRFFQYGPLNVRGSHFYKMLFFLWVKNSRTSSFIVKLDTIKKDDIRYNLSRSLQRWHTFKKKFWGRKYTYSTKFCACFFVVFFCCFFFFLHWYIFVTLVAGFQCCRVL